METLKYRLDAFRKSYDVAVIPFQFRFVALVLYFYDVDCAYCACFWTYGVKEWDYFFFLIYGDIQTAQFGV